MSQNLHFTHWPEFPEQPKLENYNFLTPWMSTRGLSVYAAKNSGDWGGFSNNRTFSVRVASLPAFTRRDQRSVEISDASRPQSVIFSHHFSGVILKGSSCATRCGLGLVVTYKPFSHELVFV